MAISLEQLTEMLSESNHAQSKEMREVIERIRATGRDDDPQRIIADLLKTQLITQLQAQFLSEGRSFLVGNYVILEKIGEGGMGTVYAARHRHMGRMVALKVIRPDRFQVKGALERFQREIRLAAELHHPNLVTSYDAGDFEGSLYLVMELIRGIDLKQQMQLKGVMSIPEALQVARQASEGLAYLHSRKLVHRDIKPSNLLIDCNGVLKILDMGLSRMINWSDDLQGSVCCDVTETGAFTGTLNFMSPEQFINPRSVDGRADIYSLGCTLYWLLTGEPPFSGKSSGEIVVAHREKPIPKLSDSIRNVPPRLERLLYRMLAKDPSLRFSKASELIMEIDALQSELAKRNDRSIISMETHEMHSTPDFSLAEENTLSKFAFALKPIIAILMIAALFGVFFLVRPYIYDSSNAEKTRNNAGAIQPLAVVDSGSTELNKISTKPSEKSEPIVTPATNDSDPNRVAAIWALRLKGKIRLKVEVESNEKFPTVESLDKLPKERFVIEWLDLSNSSLKDENFSLIADLTELTLVDLSKTGVDNKPLEYIGKLSNLKDLRLMNTKVDDAGLLKLNKLTTLKTLDLRGTRVSDKGVKHLAKFHDLESLKLGEGQESSDEGVVELAKMKSLNSLGLRNTQVTDASLNALAKLEKLEYLDLGGCKVTANGLQLFRDRKNFTLIDDGIINANNKVNSVGDKR